MPILILNSIKKNIKLLTIVLLTLLLLVLITTWYFLSKKSTDDQNNSQTATTRTDELTITQIPRKGTPSTTDGFTGLSEITILPEQEAELDQKNALRNRVPISTKDFTLGYHYNLYVFEVALAKPEETSREVFEQWRKNNYSHIPLDKFVYVTAVGNDKENYTGFYVNKNTPYEDNIFKVTAQLVSNGIPPIYIFTVNSKITDQNRLKQEVDVWLQSLDLTREQIDELDIRYQ